MKILLQKNIWQEYAYDRFLQSIKDHPHIDFEEVEVIPFTHNFVPEIDYVPDYVFGSTRFVHICRSRGFPVFPGFAGIEEFYPKELYVNGNSKVVRWGDVVINSPTFIKPMYVEKFFTGRVFENQDDLNKAQLSTSFIENENDVLVLLSEPVSIKTEVRFFIIGGKISSGSIYKTGESNGYELLTNAHSSGAWKSAQDILDSHGAICSGFVMDLGWDGENWKIVELNCIQSSGLYANDTDAIVSDIYSLWANKV